MEEMGQTFFARFIDLIWTLRFPLVFLFSSVVFKDLGRLRSHERRYALFMFSYFFLITSIYWLIKSIKKSLLVEQYQATGWVLGPWHLDAAQVELVAKEGNALLALLATLFLGRLAARFQRERFALSMIFLFLCGFLSFPVLFARSWPVTAWLFYFYGDLFVTLMIATFFAFLNDSGNSRMARRLYGLIGLGGVLGGFFGSTTVASYAKILSPSGASWVSAGTLAVMALFALLSSKQMIHVMHLQPPPHCREDQPAEPSWLHQFRTFLGSPYLLGIAFIVGLHEMASAILDYQFTATVLHFVPLAGIKAHFSNVYAFTNFIALLVQLFLTRLVLTHMGVTRALLFLPVVAIFGEAGFVLLPGLLMGSLLNTCNNAMAYSLNQSAKEALYVPMEQQAKYDGKAVIDIFVLRFAKAISIPFGLLLTAVFTGFYGLRWLSFIVLGIVVLWLVFIYKMDLRYKSLEAFKKSARRARRF